MSCENGIYGIVLASGLSKRMGRQKLLLPWRGRPLLEHVLLAAVNTPLKKVLAVVPAEDEERQRAAARFPCQLVYNPYPAKGMGYSLALAIRALPPAAEAAVICLADQPELAGSDIEAVCRIFDRHRSSLGQEETKTIIQTKYRGGRMGHPILFSRCYFDQLTSLTGDHGGRFLLKKNASHLALHQSENPYPEDIDTADDYRRFLEWCAAD